MRSWPVSDRVAMYGTTMLHCLSPQNLHRIISSIPCARKHRNQSRASGLAITDLSGG